jgi:hypothetical protein
MSVKTAQLDQLAVGEIVAKYEVEGCILSERNEGSKLIEEEIAFSW